MQYRPEIDGLRALAVIPVIFFHAGFQWFQGGYVGVDVFFVISGYLITSIILKEMEEGRFSLAHFYERRARRILPALFFIMAVCVPFAWLFLLPHHFVDFAKSMVAVSLFSSNILFWKESGYFDTAAELKPLLHTWSLAVEEQYYVIFPLLCLLLWRFGKRGLVAVFGVLFVASLCLAEYYVREKPSAAFYLLPMRGWELLLGAFAAFYFRRSGGNRLPPVLNEVGGLMGLILIILSIIVFNKHIPFPGLYALVPTIGAFFIILCAQSGTMTNKILSQRPLVGIGLISYSAYLWHQPLLAFARHYTVLEPSVGVLLFLCGVSFPLAYLSWRFVEQPLRNKENFTRRNIFTLSVGISVGFIALGLFIQGNKGFENYYLKKRVNAVQAQYYKYTDFRFSEAFVKGYKYGTCFYGREHNSFDIFDKKRCLEISAQKPNFLIIGDSHAAHFVPGFKAVFPGINILQANASGCSPLIPYQGEKRCTALLHYIFEIFLPEHSGIDAVILSSRWRPNDLERFRGTIEELRNYTPMIFVIGPTVEYKAHLSRLLMGNHVQHTVSRDSKLIKKDRFLMDSAIRNVISDIDDAQYISLVDLLCNSRVCMTVLPSGEPVAWDYGHFTLEGSVYYASKIDPVLDYAERVNAEYILMKSK